jgi:hypothetical protein
MNPDGSFIFPDSANIDAFSRIRVSQPTLLLDVKRVGGTPDILMTTSTSGTGATAYSSNRASTNLTVGPEVGTAIRQSKSRAIYQPGKSLLVLITFGMAPAQSGLRQRVGYFDAKNGVFLEQDGTTINVVRRTFVSGSAVDTKVARADWTMDQMGGVGPSHKTLDLTKPQILVMDFEWLGVGRVRVGFVIDGQICYCHQFLNANAALTSVYMSNPSLPVRWEAEATSSITGTAALEAICASVNSEGGYDITGLTASTDTGTTANAIASNSFDEVLAIRMQSAFTEFGTVFTQQISAMNTTTAAFRWRLVVNPTETGAGTWAAVPNSIMERNLTRTVTVDTGATIATGYVSSVANAVEAQARPVLTLGTTLAGVTDVFSLQIHNLSNQSEDYYGALTWREIY